MKERLKCVGRQVLACLEILNDYNETKAQKGALPRSSEHLIDLTSSLLKRAITHLLNFGG